MSKFCPILKRKVIYLDCAECEDRSRCSELTEKVNEHNNPIVTTTTVGFLKYHLIRCKCGETPVLKALLGGGYEVFCPSCGENSCPVHYATGAAIMWNRNLFDFLNAENIKEAASVLGVSNKLNEKETAQTVKDILVRGKAVK